MYCRFLLIELQLATAFPFAFAIVVGTAIKQLAAWKLEQGASLGFLEQVLGSLSVGSTLATQLCFRRINILALILLASWSLSPLGSQSCLQVLAFGNRPIIENLNVHHFNTEMIPGFYEGDIWDLPSLNALFSSSLMAPASVRESSVDLWGNVKIPDISRQIIVADTHGWLDVSLNTNTTVYSSVLGIPVSGVPHYGNTTFSMDTSYLSLHCHDNITYQVCPVGCDEPGNPDSPSWVPVNKLVPNFTNGTYYAVGASPGTTGSPFLNATFSIGINTFYEGTYGLVASLVNDTRPYEAATILFQSRWGGIAAWCPITTTYAESKVECVNAACAVIAIRPSQKRHASSNLTNLGFSSAFGELTGFLSSLSSMGQHSATSSVLEMFIVDPNLAIEGGMLWNNMSALSADDVGSRLQQVLNSYWYGSYSTPSFINSLNITPQTTGEDIDPSLALPSNGKNSSWQKIYVCRFGWLVVLFLATTVMLGAAVMSLYFGLLTRGPDLLGYFSSQLRDNPYIKFSGSESTMDGFDRARKFGKLEVKLADVEGDNRDGYLAITDDVGLFPRKLNRKRAYR
jgi:hypothetical protein